jgi:hypothetical protein
VFGAAERLIVVWSCAGSIGPRVGGELLIDDCLLVNEVALRVESEARLTRGDRAQRGHFRRRNGRHLNFLSERGRCYKHCEGERGKGLSHGILLYFP